MRVELLKGLTEEQIARINKCNSTEEILAIAKEEGIELTDEQLEAVSGGGCFDNLQHPCPECGQKWNILKSGDHYVCGECRCWYLADGTILTHGKKR